jgi:oxygen-independent coproporphyrinogen-3 oxidase
MSMPDCGPEQGEEAPGLYLHIPFCRSKCAYCAFNSVACAEPPVAYPAALALQMDHWAAGDWCGQRTFATLFLGGGTPTVYDGATLAALVSRAFALFRFHEDPEVTAESNPNSADLAALTLLRRSGVNRLSIGVQSFSDRLLTVLGRSHTAAEAREAVRAAREAGFANINLDLIYGLPGQTLADWQQTLAAALELRPEHLAAYELSIEEGTPFACLAREGALSLPAEETVAAMAEETVCSLAAAGFARYEISNYARPGYECRHNINYWRNGSYLGLGAGAVSCLSGLRLRNVDDPAQYVGLVKKGEQPFSEAECLDRAARFRETVIMGLRLCEGVRISALQRRFALTPAEYYGRILAEHISRGLVETGPDSLRLSDRGMEVANQVLAQLV